MDLATGAMDSLLSKLVEIVKDEYKLQKGVKEGVKSLQREMKSMHAALRKVAEVPQDKLDEQVKLWAREVRELSFDMEDIVDKFLVRVDDESETATKSNKLKQLTEKMIGLFTKGKDRHEIAGAIEDINKKLQEVAMRHGRYTIDNIIAMPAAAKKIDPRLGAMYKEITDLVGISGARDQELIKLLLEGDDETKKKLKILSVVGFGGLGKTTLVKAVYEKIKEDFDCRAFVPVGRNVDGKKVLMDILLDLGMYESHFTKLDERQLIDKLRERLEKKRYLIVIDDIWDETLWKVINLAFSSSNNFCSRLITTTRNASVAKLCCSSTNDFVYSMKPLSDEDSERLFYKRIFSQESGCPPRFEEVSKAILKKCGGVPLAVITVASLLARDQRVKPLDEWHALLESIGRGLNKEDPSVEDMLTILSFSYYDLPCHLKTCLLYLSMFPEDHEIRKEQLIWRWIAESFVQSEKAKISLFEIGETYFSELVNRNMIMPIYDDEDYIVVACRVHDMVLDLISSLSSEDNFVTVLNGTSDSLSTQSNVRRLSLQNPTKVEDETRPLESASLFKVRSVAAFQPGIELMPSFLNFVVLRVLDLTKCDLGDQSHINLRDLGSMIHLRYLGLAKTGITKIPEVVGKLQFLQVFDLSENAEVELPSTVINLRRLMCLLIEYAHMRLPEGLGNLISMEVLREIGCDSPGSVKELGGMKRLRDLDINFKNWSLEMEEAFVELLAKLSNIQILSISYVGDGEVSMDILGERWMPPRSLQVFYTRKHFSRFSTLPAWIRRDPLHLSQLSMLHICLGEVRPEDLDSLGKLPALCTIFLRILRSGMLLVGADGFRCLMAFTLHFGSSGEIMFQPGCMPRVEILRLLSRIPVGVMNGEAHGIGNLPSLLAADLTLKRYGVTVWEAKQAKAALEKALVAHPNGPEFGIAIIPNIPQHAGWHDACYESD